MSNFKEKQVVTRQPGSCKGGKPWPRGHLKGWRVGIMLAEPGVSCNLGQKSDGALIYSRGVRGSQLLPKPRSNLCVCVCVCVCVCDCHSGVSSPPGSPVHGILQARILEWVASQSLLQGILLTQGSHLGLLKSQWATGEALVKINARLSFLPPLISSLLFPLATTN